MVVICLKISIFVVSNTTKCKCYHSENSCDLLENFYLCGIKHNSTSCKVCSIWVVICLKISIFVVSNTTSEINHRHDVLLWFAWKFLSLWYQTQLIICCNDNKVSCDLLENFYLCGIKHNNLESCFSNGSVVICLKISIFVVSNTTPMSKEQDSMGCDLLENFYLCGIKHKSK